MKMKEKKKKELAKSGRRGSQTTCVTINIFFCVWLLLLLCTSLFVYVSARLPACVCVRCVVLNKAIICSKFKWWNSHILRRRRQNTAHFTFHFICTKRHLELKSHRSTGWLWKIANIELCHYQLNTSGIHTELGRSLKQRASSSAVWVPHRIGICCCCFAAACSCINWDNHDTTKKQNTKYMKWNSKQRVICYFCVSPILQNYYYHHHLL